VTSDQETLLIIRGTIASLPTKQQDKVHAAAEQLRALLKQDEGYTAMAFALVGAELAAQ
jgi:hypothetical protein